MNLIPRAADVPVDNIGQLFIERLADEIVVARFFGIGTDRLKKPKRRIDGVVFRRLSRVGKAIRQHPLRNIFREFDQNALCDLRAVGGKRQAIESDHRVAAPVRKPMITGDNGFTGAARYYKLIGREDQLR